MSSGQLGYCTTNVTGICLDKLPLVAEIVTVMAYDPERVPPCGAGGGMLPPPPPPHDVMVRTAAIVIPLAVFTQTSPAASRVRTTPAKKIAMRTSDTNQADGTRKLGEALCGS